MNHQHHIYKRGVHLLSLSELSSTLASNNIKIKVQYTKVSLKYYSSKLFLSNSKFCLF